MRRTRDIESFQIAPLWRDHADDIHRMRFSGVWEHLTEEERQVVRDVASTISRAQKRLRPIARRVSLLAREQEQARTA